MPCGHNGYAGHSIWRCEPGLPAAKGWPGPRAGHDQRPCCAEIPLGQRLVGSLVEDSGNQFDRSSVVGVAQQLDGASFGLPLAILDSAPQPDPPEER